MPSVETVIELVLLATSEAVAGMRDVGKSKTLLISLATVYGARCKRPTSAGGRGRGEKSKKNTTSNAHRTHALSLSPLCAHNFPLWITFQDAVTLFRKASYTA